MIDIHAVGVAAGIDRSADSGGGLIVRKDIIRQRQCAVAVDCAAVTEAAKAAGRVPVGDGQPRNAERVWREVRRGRIGPRVSADQTECP